MTGNRSIGMLASKTKAETLKYAKLCHVEDFSDENEFCQHIHYIFLTKLQESIAHLSENSAHSLKVVCNSNEVK